jgi:hypothetical protein
MWSIGLPAYARASAGKNVVNVFLNVANVYPTFALD